MIDDVPNDPDELLPTDTIFERWEEAASAGFIPVPNTLVRAQDKLGLSANDIVVLLNIMLHWWHRDRLPYPRSTAIAKRSGLGLRTVQRSIRKLQKKGFITRMRSANTSDRYDLAGLRAAVAEEARIDQWYRPTLLTSRPSGQEIGAGSGVQNSNPRRP